MEMSTKLSQEKVFKTLLKSSGSCSDNLPNYAVGLFDNKSGTGPRKRKRLNHLSAEEKIARRKLKNRVAAQTARDRKKSQFDEITKENLKLKEWIRNTAANLKKIVQELEDTKAENERLRLGLGLSPIATSKNIVNVEEASETKFTVHSLPTPDQSSDENESHAPSPGPCVYYVDSPIGTDEQNMIVMEATACEDNSDCGSSLPAVFGEHDKFPPQKETLILSEFNPIKRRHPATKMHCPSVPKLSRQQLPLTALPKHSPNKTSPSKANQTSLVIRVSSFKTESRSCARSNSLSSWSQRTLGEIQNQSPMDLSRRKD